MYAYFIDMCEVEDSYTFPMVIARLDAFERIHGRTGTTCSTTFAPSLIEIRT